MPLYLLTGAHDPNSTQLFDKTGKPEQCLQHIYSHYSSINKAVLPDVQPVVTTTIPSHPPLLTIDHPGVLFVYQREAAVVDLANCHQFSHIGSDDATTCHIIFLVSHNATGNGQLLMAVSHLDDSDVQANVQKLLQSFPPASDVDVYLFGGYDDDVSRCLSLQILAALMDNDVNKCTLKCAVITKLNSTIRDGETTARPVNYGIAYSVADKTFHSARFTNRQPDSCVREVQIMFGSKDLHFVYSPLQDTLAIQPFWYQTPGYAKSISRASSSFILSHLSTSPSCEPPHFADHMRKVMQFLLDNPDPSVQFRNKPRCWKLEVDSWKCTSGHV